MPKARQALAFVVNSIAAVVIAIAIFLALANVGLISRPASEDFTFGGGGLVTGICSSAEGFKNDYRRKIEPDVEARRDAPQSLELRHVCRSSTNSPESSRCESQAAPREQRAGHATGFGRVVRHPNFVLSRPAFRFKRRCRACGTLIGRQETMPWVLFSRRPNNEGLTCPAGRRAPVGVHHGGDRPRRPLVRVRWGHPIPEWAVPRRGSRRRTN
jgi:hypothetical protein